MFKHIFLDTSYLMPYFGLEIAIPKFLSEIRQLLQQKELQFCFSPVSIIEIKWLVIKKIRENPTLEEELEQRYMDGCNTFSTDKRFKRIDFIDGKVNFIEYQLRKLGHKDYFDRIIASSAIISADVLLTEDEPLVTVIRKFFRQENTKFAIIDLGNWNEKIVSLLEK